MSKKRKYSQPEIFQIKIDAEISLALESIPQDPGEPGMSQIINTEIKGRTPYFSVFI